MQQFPTPPFTQESARAKVQIIEDAWNTRDAKKVVQAHSPDCIWRNREEFFQGQAAIEFFLKRKWELELGYQLKMELWSFTDKRISVHLVYEWQHAGTLQRYRSHGNERWEFDSDGYMTRRDISANDVLIPNHEHRLNNSGGISND